MRRRIANSCAPWLGKELLLPTLIFGAILIHIPSVSYRDLLGTAERIIEMDGQMQEVEMILGQAGHKCNSGAVDRIFTNYGRYHAEKSLKSEAILPM
jgi:hypothetical protein